MPYYQSHFKVETTGSNTSLIFAMYTVGQMCASFIAGPIADRFGRRIGMAVGASFIIIGAIVGACAPDMDALIGARFILGFGVAILTTAAPSVSTRISYDGFR